VTLQRYQSCERGFVIELSEKTSERAGTCDLRWVTRSTDRARRRLRGHVKARASRALDSEPVLSCHSGLCASRPRVGRSDGATGPDADFREARRVLRPRTGEKRHIISVEVPTNRADADLVRKFMTHNHPISGPLSVYCDPKGTGKCRFGYPKPLCTETTVDFSGRVQYRRRRPGDEWIVPHNLSLIRRWLCHINVEIAASSQLFQYLFKYLHKGILLLINRRWCAYCRFLGPDYTRFRIANGEDGAYASFDEMAEYQTARYLSSGEAVWRIFGFDITSITPSVTGLPVHTPGSLRHHQYHRKDGSQSTLSKLERYFLRPDGEFVVGDRTISFEDVSYADYYAHFHHEKEPPPPTSSSPWWLTRAPADPSQRRLYAVQRAHQQDRGTLAARGDRLPCPTSSDGTNQPGDFCRRHPRSWMVRYGDFWQITSWWPPARPGHHASPELSMVV
jgi:hypothetical protein